MTACPRCKSQNVEVTCMGFFGPPSHDPNRATCADCKHVGKAGDWHIANAALAEVERLRKERDEALALFNKEASRAIAAESEVAERDRVADLNKRWGRK